MQACAITLIKHFYQRKKQDYMPHYYENAYIKKLWE